MWGPVVRTDFLMPHEAFLVKKWFGSIVNARRLLGLTHLSDQMMWRAVRGDRCRPEDIEAIESALERWARRNNKYHELEGRPPNYEERDVLSRIWKLVESSPTNPVTFDHEIYLELWGMF
jgi:hypothetical protein